MVINNKHTREQLMSKSPLGKAYNLEELPEETIKSISTTKMDERHDHLNHLME